MRALVRFVLLASFVLVSPSPTRPATAAVLEMQGSFEMRIANLPPIVFSQTPPTLLISVSSAGGSFSDPAGIFSGFAALPTPLFTGVPLISSFNVTAANLGGSFAAGGGPGGGFGGPEPLTGIGRFGILGLSTIPFALSPIGQNAGINVVVAQLSMTLVGGSFTTAVAVVTNITTELTRATPSDSVGCAPVLCGRGFGGLGVFVNTVTLSGADDRTAGHAGTIALVSPIQFMSNAAGGMPGFVTKRFTFVPEPGTLVLLGSSALVALAWGAARRRR